MPNLHPPSPIGRRLRAVRQALGLSQSALAERAGMSQDAISRMETKDRLLRARGDTIRRLADALRVKVSDLIG